MNQTTTLTHPLSNYEPFQAWLEAQPATTQVGVRTLDNNCPLARFLQSLGFKNAEVYGACYFLDGDNLYTMRHHEPWTHHFVRLIDSRACTREETMFVTAEEARRALRNAVYCAELDQEAAKVEVSLDWETVEVKELVTA